ncbi:hypothetical protein QTP70_034542 [Hemibagrus guttatus]|uniref:Uncharacterized protein n=1 Tax=Hemibagrus guttatus TaxID=175788 RepID=A0AAE0V920_9TELE|nr:hypothetical protein QTP70_034542 [Hemibagrus guttatus]
MKNGKAKALSHHHDPVSTPSCPELILHPSMVLAQIRWDIKEEIQWAQTTEPPPSACPPSKLFVRPALHPSTWWIGRGRPQKNNHGSMQTTFWTPHWWRNSITSTPTDPLHDSGGALGIEHQEVFLEAGFVTSPPAPGCQREPLPEF